MALIDITPVMTSNRTPSPYVASGSSLLSANYDYYKAFNNTLIDSSDAWANNGTVSGWLKFDFGIPTNIDAFSIYARDEVATPVATAPKQFTLLGSNDDLNFTVIKEVIFPQTDWKQRESRLFKLDTTYSFRYYKLIVYSNNGHVTSIIIGQLKFFQDDNLSPTISNNKASMIYMLPSNTKNKLDSRQNDPREGMLAYISDDTSYYGELRMVGNRGEFIIPKTAMCEPDVLFSGGIAVDTLCTLNNNIDNYKFIYINMHRVNVDSDSKMLNATDIKGKVNSYTTWEKENSLSASRIARISYYFKTGSSEGQTGSMYFISNNTFKILALSGGSLPFTAIEIVGIK